MSSTIDINDKNANVNNNDSNDNNNENNDKDNNDNNDDNDDNDDNGIEGYGSDGLRNKYDLIVDGTSLVASIVACAAGLSSSLLLSFIMISIHV